LSTTLPAVLQCPLVLKLRIVWIYIFFRYQEVWLGEFAPED
jgi:hypothetical protein